MIVKYHKLALTAVLGLAITFTFSCSSPDDNNGGGNGNGGSNNPSAGPCPNATTSNGSMSCGGQTYKTVQIGDQVWMAKNLNYNVSGSRCHGNAESDCNKYGRLYNWETAKTVCPSGWYLPSRSDWDELISYVESDSGCEDCAGKHLKAKSGWNSGGNGADTYEFAALPGGHGYSTGGYSGDGYWFTSVGDDSWWWSATESGNNAHKIIMSYSRDIVEKASSGGYPDLLFVRCVQN